MTLITHEDTDAEIDAFVRISYRLMVRQRRISGRTQLGLDQAHRIALEEHQRRTEVRHG